MLRPYAIGDYHPMKTIVIGLGNPILGDDGVGWKVMKQLTPHFSRIMPHIEADCLSLGGLSLMERLIGYERTILIDAIQTGQHPVGTVTRYRLEELPDHTAGHLGSAHDMSLQTALKLGHSIGARLPDEVKVVGIEAERVYDFSEELTPPVAAAVPKAVQLVLELLQRQEEQSHDLP
jgi:hydrogenase maturation protease